MRLLFAGYLFPKTFHRDETFHLDSLLNYQVFHTNGKRFNLTNTNCKTDCGKTERLHCEQALQLGDIVRSHALEARESGRESRGLARAFSLSTFHL